MEATGGIEVRVHVYVTVDQSGQDGRWSQIVQRACLSRGGYRGGTLHDVDDAIAANHYRAVRNTAAAAVEDLRRADDDCTAGEHGLRPDGCAQDAAKHGRADPVARDLRSQAHCRSSSGLLIFRA